MKILQRRFALIRRCGLGVLMVVPLFFALGAPTQASVVYSYTGNNFTNILNQNPPAGTYDTTMRVTGSITVAGTLATLASLPSATDITALVSSYSFSDGRQTLDTGNSLIFGTRMGTNAAGVPTSWFFGAVQPLNNPSFVGEVDRRIQTFNEAFFFDQGQISICSLISSTTGQCLAQSVDFGSQTTNQGTWTVTPTVVPLPPAALLFGSGLVALYGYARAGRRRRRQV